MISNYKTLIVFFLFLVAMSYCYTQNRSTLTNEKAFEQLIDDYNKLPVIINKAGDVDDIIVYAINQEENNALQIVNTLLSVNPSAHQNLDTQEIVPIEDFPSEKQLARLCIDFSIGYKRARNSIDVVRKRLNVYIKDNNYQMTADELLNKKYHKIICKHRAGSRIRKEATLYKYALERKDYEFLRHTIAKPGCHDTLDPGVWDMVNGKKETVVDFIDVILADPYADAEHDIGPLKSIRRIISNCTKKKNGTLGK